MAAAIGQMIVLRVVALDSDAYSRLSWSSGLLTDEGFYLHNARNVVLFGHATTDAWNNALLMPALHFVQVAWFRWLGVGAVQARLLSVLCSLLMLLCFFVALRRAFGVRVAAVSTLLLGLDHTNLLYNRLALMDTPALLPLGLAFVCFVQAFPSKEGAELRPGWLMGCGLCFCLAYAVRGWCAFLMPVPLVVLWRKGASGRRGVRWFLLGLGLGLGVYGLLWYLPHRRELTRLNYYYLTQQLLPGSLKHLGQNLEHALVGDERGLSPYLLRHTPVQTVLAILAWGGWAGLRANWNVRERACGSFLLGWLLVLVGLLCVVSYSPSRYYVLFYPAMAALAGIGLVHGKEVWKVWAERPVWRALLGGWVGYHLAEAVLHQGNSWHTVGLWSAALLGAWGLGRWNAPLLSPPRPAHSGGREIAPPNPQLGGSSRRSPNSPQTWGARGAGSQAWAGRGATTLCILGLWAVVNGYWLGDWLGHLSYRQKQADAWLQQNLPPNSVLLGAIAPGLCLNNHFVAVNMMEDLCNDNHPVERFASAPRYIVLLDVNQWKEKWWVKHYPELVRPEHRLHLFPHVLRHDFYVGIYPVPPATPEAR